MTWGVTHVCNLRCDHCYDVIRQRRTDLTTDQALRAISRLAQAGVTFIVFSGGEPLARKDLFQLMEQCGAQGIQIGMRSNGTLITREVAQHLASLDLRVAGISLDGVDAETHDRVRGQGSFQKTHDGVMALLSCGVRVNVEVVLSQRNVHQSLEFVRLAEAWGIDVMNFSAMTSHGRAEQLDSVLLDHETWRDVTTQLYHASQAAHVAVSPSCALTGACWACVEPNITCDGWVTPCYLSKKRLFHILEAEPQEFNALLRRSRPRRSASVGAGAGLTRHANEC